MAILSLKTRPERTVFVFGCICILIIATALFSAGGNDKIKSLHQNVQSSITKLTSHEDSDNENGEGKFAYATLLTADIDTNAAPEAWLKYWTATRMLSYQILHAPETRTNNSIPFLVLVTNDISQRRRDKLESDGATVVPIEKIEEGKDWVHGNEARWQDLFAKLRLWQLKQYSKILFLDNDSILFRNMDDIFTIESTIPTPIVPRENLTVDVPTDEGPLPDRYLFASTAETIPGGDHGEYPYPDYFCAGFFLMSPSQKIFDHYMSILKIKDRFDSQYMEQNLLNYAHRWGGQMPWREIGSSWNVRFPDIKDVNRGVRSIHEKWWYFDKSSPIGKKVNDIQESMERFYKERDLKRRQELDPPPIDIGDDQPIDPDEEDEAAADNAHGKKSSR